MSRRLSLAFLLAFATAVPAGAGPATPDGAQKLKETFKTYLGTYADAVTVVPQGEIYQVKIDPAGLMSGLKALGASGSGAPMALALTDLGDGKWDVAGDGPIAIAMAIPGLLTFDLQADNQKWSGVFDESLKAFATSQAEVTGFSLHEIVTQPNQPETNVSYSIDKLTIASTATAGAAGGVDGTLQYSASGLNQTFTLPAGPQMPGPMDVNIKVESYVADGKVVAMQMPAIMDLWVWFVAHPDKAAIEQDFGAMKQKLRAALPLFDNLKVGGTMTNLKATTPFGGLSADAAGIELDANGAKADGKLHEKIALRGLKLPTEVMPSWMPPFLPDAATLDVTLDGFNLAAPAHVFLDAAKPAETLSPEVKAELMQAFLPDGTVNVVLGSSGFRSEMYSLSLEGDLKAGPAMPKPVGTAFVKFTGLDAVMTALQSAPPEVSQQAIPGMMMARGMAKNEGPDSYSWSVEMGEGGKISVNGVDMGAMGGAQ